MAPLVGNEWAMTNDGGAKRPSTAVMVLVVVAAAIFFLGLLRVVDFVFSWTFLLLIVAVIAVIAWARSR
jgi:hypothetical protein